MADSLQNKVIVVTGATSGIGQRCAELIAMKGALVALAARNEARARPIINELCARGLQVVWQRLDVTDYRSVDICFNNLRKELGSIHGLVNSAGILGDRGLTEICTEGNWGGVIDTNLTGTWRCMRAVLPDMRSQRSGHIVNVASIVGLCGFPGLAAYTASKAGVIQLTRTAALEYAKDGIRINCVCPGSIRTPMLDQLLANDADLLKHLLDIHPMGRLGVPDDVAEAVCWLLSSSSSFITGHSLPVAGGWEVK